MAQPPSTSWSSPASAFSLDQIIEGEFSVEASDVIRLLLGFLTAQGLHESARVLRKESGVGFLVKAAPTTGSSSSSSSSNVRGAVIQPKATAQAIRQGDWGNVQKASLLWQDYDDNNDADTAAAAAARGDSLVARIAEQVILELAEEDPYLSLAYSMFKVHREALDHIGEVEETEDAKADDKSHQTIGRKNDVSSSNMISKARSLEQRLAAISANPTKFTDIKARQQVLYGKTSKQSRREVLARRVEDHRAVPLDRLPVLLQQALKWQAHTGQLPWIKEVLLLEQETEDDDAMKDEGHDRPTKKRRKRKRYDLVMGEAAMDVGVMVGENNVRGGVDDEDDEFEARRSVPQDILAKVKFGKSAVCESALFSSRGLFTGSSDGLIEIWDGVSSYQDLNTVDYPFQKENAMGHKDVAILCMSLSNDEEILASGDANGKVKLWKTTSGKCLRQFQAHDGAITALSLSRDSSKLLTGSSSGIAREFGVLNQTVLKEFQGHTSYVYACHYVLEWSFSSDKNPNSAAGEGWVLTASGDGTVRFWKKGICIRILQPPSTSGGQRALSLGKSSLVIDPTELMAEAPAIHSLIPLFGVASRILLVPRASTAYLVNLEGIVLQSYHADTDDVEFAAATATPSVVYLTTTKGDCLVFSIHSGKRLMSIGEFSKDSTAKTNADHHSAEISSMAHHPFKPSVLAAFSNDKTQKKGVLAVWK